MRHHRQELSFTRLGERGFVNITPQAGGWVNARHITTSVFIMILGE